MVIADSLCQRVFNFNMATQVGNLVRNILYLGVIWTLPTLDCTPDTEDAYIFEAGNQQNQDYAEAKPTRFLLYDVNPGEGFNLRRDVYMRVANLVKLLNEEEPWTLVLPPWGRLYHWRSQILQSMVPWATFFDLDSLQRHAPVIEFKHFLKVIGKPEIEEIYYLQRYKEGWRNGKWEERMDIRECIDQTGFEEDAHGDWHWWFWGFDMVVGKRFQCMSIQAEYEHMKPFLLHNTSAGSVFLARAEHLIHGKYSEWSPEWWTARRSMRFAEGLREVGDDFRRRELDSTDEQDQTVTDEDWTKMERRHGDALGGPYLAAHLRRQDFLYGHKDDVPSIKGTAQQIKSALKKNNLSTVFVATDAPQKEFEELQEYLKDYRVLRFQATKSMLDKHKDGGVAIIDQWICAHARFFIGTSVSTFSFRIHEEREILGFQPDTTFNRFCGDTQKDCDQPSKWAIKYKS